MPDSKINRQIESEAHKKLIHERWNPSKILKGNLEIVRLSLLRKIETDSTALMSYGISSILPARHNEKRVLQFSNGMNTVRVACRRLTMLAHVEISCSWCGISSMLWFTGLHEFVHQSGDLIVYAPLDRKPMKLLQSLGDANASPLTCDNTSERALQTLKPRNVLNLDLRGSSWRNRCDNRREKRRWSSLVWRWDECGGVHGCDGKRTLKVQSCVHQMRVYCRA